MAPYKGVCGGGGQRSQFRGTKNEFCVYPLIAEMPMFANNAHTWDLVKSVHTQMPLVCMLGTSRVWRGEVATPPWDGHIYPVHLRLDVVHGKSSTCSRVSFAMDVPRWER